MNGVVIVAAGTGSRMNMGINKQFIKLEGKEIIAYTIEKGKVFDFNIIGIILPLGNNSFSIKPIFVELVLPM